MAPRKGWQYIEWFAIGAAFVMLCVAGVYLLNEWLTPSTSLSQASIFSSIGSFLFITVYILIPMKIPIYPVEVRSTGILVEAIPKGFWISQQAITELSMIDGYHIKYKRGGIAMRLAITEQSARNVLAANPRLVLLSE